MAQHGISECFMREDRWFSGVVVTDGAGCPPRRTLCRLRRRSMRRVRLPNSARRPSSGLLRPGPAGLSQRRGQRPARQRPGGGPDGRAQGGAAGDPLSPQPGRQARHPRGGHVQVPGSRAPPAAAAAAPASPGLRGLAQPGLARRRGQEDPAGRRSGPTSAPPCLASTIPRSAAASATTWPPSAGAWPTPPTRPRTRRIGTAP